MRNNQTGSASCINTSGIQETNSSKTDRPDSVSCPSCEEEITFEMLREIFFESLKEE